MRLFLFIPLSLIGCMDNRIQEIKDKTSSEPSLIVEPNELNFGLVQPGNSIADLITIRNEGTEG